MVTPRKEGQPDYYLFVIDTNSYAGNFEREMCAYITGQIGECGVGKEIAELTRQEIPDEVARLEELVESVPDEHGCHRPVSIFPTPGWFNHGKGGHFRDGQEKEALTHYKQCQRKIDDANALTEVQKHPAFMSVAIYFHTIPDRDLVDMMKQRARYIASQGVGLKGYEQIVRIEGFRLLEQHTTYKELNI